MVYLFFIVNVVLNDVFGGVGWVYFIFVGFVFLWVVFVSGCVFEICGWKDVDEVWGCMRRVD